MSTARVNAEILNRRFQESEVLVHVNDTIEPYQSTLKRRPYISASALFASLAMVHGKICMPLAQIRKPFVVVPIVGLILKPSTQIQCAYMCDALTGSLHDGCAQEGHIHTNIRRFWSQKHDNYASRESQACEGCVYNELIIERRSIQMEATFSAERHMPAQFFLNIHNITHPFSNF